MLRLRLMRYFQPGNDPALSTTPTHTPIHARYGHSGGEGAIVDGSGGSGKSRAGSNFGGEGSYKQGQTLAFVPLRCFVSLAIRRIGTSGDSGAGRGGRGGERRIRYRAEAEVPTTTGLVPSITAAATTVAAATAESLAPQYHNPTPPHHNSKYWQPITATTAMTTATTILYDSRLCPCRYSRW